MFKYILSRVERIKSGLNVQNMTYKPFGTHILLTRLTTFTTKPTNLSRVQKDYRIKICKCNVVQNFIYHIGSTMTFNHRFLVQQQKKIALFPVHCGDEAQSIDSHLNENNI